MLHIDRGRSLLRALLARSFAELRNVELGYATDQRLTLQLALPTADYPDAAAVAGLYERLLERVTWDLGSALSRISRAFRCWASSDLIPQFRSAGVAVCS